MPSRVRGWAKLSCREPQTRASAPAPPPRVHTCCVVAVLGRSSVATRSPPGSERPDGAWAPGFSALGFAVWGCLCPPSPRHSALGSGSWKLVYVLFSNMMAELKPNIFRINIFIWKIKTFSWKTNFMIAAEKPILKVLWQPYVLFFFQLKINL